MPNRRYDQSSKGRFRTLRKEARRKGAVMALTIEQYEALHAMECFYHQGPCDHSQGMGHGIDRRVRDKGYTIENAVRCCSPCNFEKGNMESSAYLAVWRHRHRHGVINWHDPRLKGSMHGKARQVIERMRERE